MYHVYCILKKTPNKHNKCAHMQIKCCEMYSFCAILLLVSIVIWKETTHKSHSNLVLNLKLTHTT